MKKFVIFCMFFGFLQGLEASQVDHKILVHLNPDQHELEVSSKISLDQCIPKKKYRLYLHSGLHPRLKTPHAKLVFVGSEKAGVPIDVFDLSFPNLNCSVHLNYGGKIYHSPQQELAPGSIQPEGVSLMGSTYWYPQLESVSLVSMELSVNVPSQWYVVSQGESLGENLQGNSWVFQWQETKPQDALYLIAGKFYRSTSVKNGRESLVYLRSRDEELAQMYHQLTHENLEFYSQLIGPYPYKKFATIENFWETGFGLPSMTLLGPTVIRLPFLAYSSFPHEILHNWWGNGVYIDFSEGNWSEGLTSYLADHYFQELRGQGRDYRRSALQNFSSYVTNGNDFPLNEFKGRHNDSTKAIGYDKSLFFFHMLKIDLGEEVFFKGLQKFFKDNLFKEASYPELLVAFNSVSAKSLDNFFAQWTTRKGAPLLQLHSADQKMIDGKYQIDIRLKQDPIDVFDLKIPWKVTFVDDTVELGTHDMVMSDSHFRLKSEKEVRSLSIDPNFDVFRKPHSEEIPNVVANVIGYTESSQLVVLPNNSESTFKPFFEAWAQQKPNKFDFIDAQNLKTLPTSDVVWVVGWDNPLLSEVIPLAKNVGVDLSANGIKLLNKNYSPSSSAVLLVFKKVDSDKIIVWLGADETKDVVALGRKVTHYGKYSYLAFDQSSQNSLKGQWSILESPMSHQFQ